MKRNEVIWFFILALITYYFYHLISNDLLGNYIHPRMFGYVYFAFSVLCLFTISQLLRMLIVSGQQKNRHGYFIFMLPILVVAVIRPTILSAGSVVDESVDLLSTGIFQAVVVDSDDHSSTDQLILDQDVTVDETIEAVEAVELTESLELETPETDILETDIDTTIDTSTDELAVIENDNTQMTDVEASELGEVETGTATSPNGVDQQASENVTTQSATPLSEIETPLVEADTSPTELGLEQGTNEVCTDGACNVQGCIIDELYNQGFTDEGDQFMELIRLSYEDVGVMDGKTTTVKGFVINQERFASNQFFLGRMVITCCASCAMPDGFLCQTDGPIDIPTDTWIEITGTYNNAIYYSEFLGEDVLLPILTVESIDYISMPKDPYVYLVWNN